MTERGGTDGGTADQLHELAVELAVGAAEVVRGGLGRAASGSDTDALDTQSKSTETDLVTEVDRETERWLAAAIAAHRPHDEILGEEDGLHTPSDASGVRWIVDPIDGTVNFVLGLPQYAVSVAAQRDGHVVAGAVCNPATGELFHALRGGGAKLRRGDVETVLTGPRDVPLARAVLATGFGYDAARRARQVAVVAPLLPRVADIRRLGAASLDLCYLAAGRVDGYFEAGLNPWDHAAGGLIAQEAGCVLSGLRGRPPSDTLLAAAGPALAAELFAALEELGADTVY